MFNTRLLRNGKVVWFSDTSTKKTLLLATGCVSGSDLKEKPLHKKREGLIKLEEKTIS